MNDKIMFIWIQLINDWQNVAKFSSFRAASATNFLYFFTKKYPKRKQQFNQERKLLGQTVVFLLPRKPGLYVTRLHFFFIPNLIEFEPRKGFIILNRLNFWKIKVIICYVRLFSLRFTKIYMSFPNETIRNLRKEAGSGNF